MYTFCVPNSLFPLLLLQRHLTDVHLVNFETYLLKLHCKPFSLSGIFELVKMQ